MSTPALEEHDYGDFSTKRKVELEDFLLSDKCYRLPYVYKSEEQRRALRSTKWGQRKLFCGELFFILINGIHKLERVSMVYAGAAPGTHIHFLAELFPNIHWYLVDPSQFKVAKHKNITVIDSLFTDEVIDKLLVKIPHDELYFISDIRSTTYNVGDEIEDINSIVQSDMKLQEQWVRKMRPVLSMLKFRLPYNSEEDARTEYLLGSIFFQQWAGRSSTETRIIVRRPPNDEEYPSFHYNNVDYDNIMFCFNILTRHRSFITRINSKGFTDDFDSAAEEFLWEKYLLDHGMRVTKENVESLADRLSNVIFNKKGQRLTGLEFKRQTSNKKYQGRPKPS